MTPQELVIELSKSIPEVDELQKQKVDIKIQIDKLEENHLKEIYGKLTVSNVKSIWKKADQMQRFNILDSIPEFKDQFDKLDDYGGLRSGELMQAVIEAKWNDTEWIDDMESYFVLYCKEDCSHDDMKITDVDSRTEWFDETGTCRKCGEVGTRRCNLQQNGSRIYDEWEFDEDD